MEQTTTQTSVKVDEASTRSAKNKPYQDIVEKSEASKLARQYTAAVTQEPDDNISIVTQYRPDLEPTSGGPASTQTDGKLKVLKAMPPLQVSSALNLQAGLLKPEVVADKPRSTQATETNDPSKMQPAHDRFRYTDTAQQGEPSRATDHKQADRLAVDNPFSVSASSLASNPDIGVIMHSKLARNSVRERGTAVKLYDGADTEDSTPLKLPMAEALVATQAATGTQAENVSTPELCEQCAA